MKALAGIVFVIHTIGLIGGSFIWPSAMNKTVSDNMHFKLMMVWRVKREWFEEGGYRLYITAYIAVGEGIIAGIIYRLYLK